MQDFSAKYIYEPWKAPIADQKAANCRIGVDYPRPICDHAQVSKENVEKLKQAYANQPQHGKSPAKASAAASKAHAAAGQLQTATGQLQTAAGQLLNGSAHFSSGAGQFANRAEAGQDASGAQQSGTRKPGDSTKQGGTQAAPSVAGSTHLDKLPHYVAHQPKGNSSKQRSNSSGLQQAHPPSGFEDVAVPSDPQETGMHQTDAAEPDASMPGGCASGKSTKPLKPDDNSASVGLKGGEVPEALAKQKKLDWTAVAAFGEKRKRNDAAETSPQGKRRSPRQRKLSFIGNSNC